jgi:hypothetical protein
MTNAQPPMDGLVAGLTWIGEIFKRDPELGLRYLAEANSMEYGATSADGIRIALKDHHRRTRSWTFNGTHWFGKPSGELIELKREFAANQLPALESDLRIFLDAHPIFGDLPRQDRDNAAHSAATHLLLAIRSQTVVRLVR